jgi:hypothetical protein
VCRLRLPRRAPRNVAHESTVTRGQSAAIANAIPNFPEEDFGTTTSEFTLNITSDLLLLARNPRGMPTMPLQALGSAFGECQSQVARSSRPLIGSPCTRLGPLSEVGFHHVDHLIGRECLLRIRFSLWVKYMVSNVAFKEFGH